MQIQVVTQSVSTQTNSKGKPMQVLEVIYKNLTFQGKVETKKLFDFGAQKDVFPVLAASAAGQVYEVEVVKNNSGYNDWVSIKKSDGASDVPTPVTTKTNSGIQSSVSVGGSTKGTWETPEERAKKQIYIVRQSSLSAAISTLTVGKKTELKPEEVIELAQRYEAFVFGSGVEETVAKDVGSVAGFGADFTEDLPY